MKTMNEEKLNQMADFIHRYVEENNGVSPKFSEILVYMKMSKSVGYRYLTVLRDRGVIEYQGRSSLAVQGQEQMKPHVRRIGIFGAIPCGAPEEYRQEVRGYLSLPEEWVEGECYLLRATGDSMIDVGIDDGDLVLIRRTEQAYDGQIVAVLTEEGTTLKRLIQREGERAWLLAENRTYPKAQREMKPSHIAVQGVACKVIKNLL